MVSLAQPPDYRRARHVSRRNWIRLDRPGAALFPCRRIAGNFRDGHSVIEISVGRMMLKPCAGDGLLPTDRIIHTIHRAGPNELKGTRHTRGRNEPVTEDAAAAIDVMPEFHFASHRIEYATLADRAHRPPSRRLVLDTPRLDSRRQSRA